MDWREGITRLGIGVIIAFIALGLEIWELVTLKKFRKKKLD